MQTPNERENSTPYNLSFEFGLGETDEFYNYFTTR